MRSLGLYVGGVCITQYAGQNAADAFIKRLNTLGVRNYRHYPIAGYPSDVAHIVSDEGFGRNEYIETTHSLIVVTAPGPGSGKMATCLSQLYHEHKHGVSAGYAKFETFPIWNLPLKHPVNLAYEAATADLDDGEVRIAAAQRAELGSCHVGEGVRQRRDRQRDEHLVRVQARVVVAERLDLER